MTRRRKWAILGAGLVVMVSAEWVWLSTVISPYPAVDEAPVEGNRVRHPAGFSIIRPGRTRAIVSKRGEVDPEMITILPDGGRSRYTPVMTALHLDNTPETGWLEWEGYKPGTFQGREAYVYRGPSGKYDSYGVITERSGKWYVISLLIPSGGELAGGELPERWRRYLESFEVGEK